MPNQTKVNLKEFVDAGYLQEVNRQFFHPLGMALEISKKGNEYGLDGLWDFRSIKGGIKFSEDVINSKDFINKANNIKALQKEAKAIRKVLYGEITQKVNASFEDE